MSDTFNEFFGLAVALLYVLTLIRTRQLQRDIDEINEKLDGRKP